MVRSRHALVPPQVGGQNGVTHGEPRVRAAPPRYPRGLHGYFRPQEESLMHGAEEIPPHVRCRQFLLAGLTAGRVVLDVGCGTGELMAELAGRGCSVTGVEIDPSLVESCRAAGFQANEGRAERLPAADGSLDAIVCSVVLPYTDERKAVVEWARVLRPGGVINATYHGLGYGLNYLTHHPGLKNRFYGLRMLANTAFYGLTGRRLPGLLGDTLCQTGRRLRSYYRSVGLELHTEQVVGKCMGHPIFLCHRVVKAPAAPAGAADGGGRRGS